MEHQLADIGQIAVTVSDMAIALPFDRDVLGANSVLYFPRSAFVAETESLEYVALDEFQEIAVLSEEKM